MPYIGNVPSSFNVGTDNINNDAITTAKIADGAILNADVNSAAAIAGTKISPDFGSQNILTTGTSTAASLIPTGSSVPTNGFYLPSANNVAISTNGSKRLHVDASGNVGIGMTPVYAFDVTAGNGNAIRFTDSVNSVQNLIGAFNSNGFIGTASNHPLYFTTNGSERMRLDTSGRLGLGTSSPSGLFDARGFSYLSGAQIRDSFHVAKGYVQGDARGFLLATDGSTNIVFDVNGTERVRLDTSGRLGIGTTSPGYKLHCVGDARFESSNVFLDDDNKALVFGTGTTAYIIGSSTNNNIRFVTNSSERGRWDSSGRFLVGTSTARSNFFNTSVVAPQLQIEGTSSATAGLALISNNTSDGSNSTLYFAKSKGSAVGSNTVVASNDILGGISFQGNDGTEFVEAASIVSYVDGTPGANDMPGRLVFSTTADGASSPTERMRLQANGKLLLGTTSSNYGNFYQLEVDGGASDAQLNKTSAGAGGGCFGAWNATTSGNSAFIFFFTESSITLRGSIDYNRAAGQVRYNVTSDRRLKSDIEDASSALNILNQVKVRSYTWTETGYGVEYGFIAQELNEVVPDAVKVGDDGDDVVDTWAVDNTKLVPLLTKALQEALQKIDAMEARLAALEAS